MNKRRGQSSLSSSSSCYWQPDGFSGIELLRAERSNHRYRKHAHEGYALGVVESGAHAFAARGAVWTALPGRVIIVNPEDVHDGGPARGGAGYSYRMVYLDPAIMKRVASEATASSRGGPFFPDAVVDDPALAARILRLHRALEAPTPRLEREARIFDAALQLARRHGGAPAEPRPADRGRPIVDAALDVLAANFAEDLSLSELAAVVGVDRFRLLRAFRRCLGLPPHAYQTQLRLRYAKRLIAAGEAPAMAAVAAGFADQSHLIRTFKAAYGVTPGQYRGRRNIVQ